jgi:hypothetical protein
VRTDTTRFLFTHAFAVFVFGLGFYALVIYEFALPELIQGAFISFMTLAAQFVFGESLASSVGRRSQANFEAGMAAQTSSQPHIEVTSGPPPEVTIEPNEDRLRRG